MSWLLTWSGLHLDVLDPQPDQINILDIAHGLANECRFAGQCRVFYSVGQHSVLASQNVSKSHALEALLHDAAEAYIKDIPSPLKALLPEYRAIEERLARVIRYRFGLPMTLSPEVKQADLRLLATERRDLMRYDPADWSALRGIAPLEKRIIAANATSARALFQQRFLQLAWAADNPSRILHGS